MRNTKKAKQNPHCPVPGCRAKAPHNSDSLVAAMMHEFSSPERLTLWALTSMAELRNSICRDLMEKQVFAFFTRLRQPEELYVRTLYALFVASAAELPHLVSGATPNGLSGMYEKVNKKVLGGRGLLLVTQSGLRQGTFKPVDTLHDGAHASFRAMMTCIGWSLNPEQVPDPEKYCKHMERYCAYLNYMHGMFKAGKSRDDVLDGVRNLHKPAPPQP